MTQAIQPIETEYAGCRFRSRLEARWAVFFDRLGTKWLYEPQGYVLGNGDTYLPDFWLSDWGVWAEVKGAPTEADFIKLHAATAADGLPIAYGGQALSRVLEPRDLAAIPPMRRILLLGEIPDASSSKFGWPDEGVLHNMTVITGRGPRMQSVAVWFMSLIEVMGQGAWESRPELFDGLQNGAVRLHAHTAKAYQAARSARFEFGERG